jgi:acetylornithine deacetylase/succinyl-diaminopimelate desuccinylase-like protein
MSETISTRFDRQVAATLEIGEVNRAFARFEELLPTVVNDTVRISEVAAPPFGEQRRAALVAELMREAGLEGVHVDGAPNAVGFLPALGAGAPGRGRALLVAAHIDTVFPDGTDVTVHREGGILRGPGCGDNSASVAVMLCVARVMKELGLRLPLEVIFAGDAGEEGLGDLRGMKVLLRAYRDRLACALAADGGLGAVIHWGVGSRRLKVTTRTPGGHSYGSFGVPSAIHGLGRMIAGIAELKVPAKPKTTFNVGVIGGGTSVNTIAPEAWMLVDMRSEDAMALAALEQDVRAVIGEGAVRGQCSVAVEVVGDRPAGGLPLQADLPQKALAVLRALGIPTFTEAGSTDANVPLSAGIPAVCIGVKRGGDAHRVTDFVEVDSLLPGMKNLLLCMIMASGYGTPEAAGPSGAVR